MISQHAQQPFDAAILVSLGIHWLPSVVDVPLPSVWGPVSGGAHSPRRLWAVLGLSGVVAEAVEALLTKVPSAFSWTRRTRATADVRLAESPSARDRLPRRLREGTQLVNRAAARVALVEPGWTSEPLGAWVRR